MAARRCSSSTDMAATKACCRCLRNRNLPRRVITSCVFGLPRENVPGRPPLKTPGNDMHAGESETSHMLVARPDLVHMDRADSESGADQARLQLPENVYTGIWWYARFPEHYSGQGSAATKELGEFDQKTWSSQIADAIKAVKADTQALKLQNEFFEKTQHPIDTKQ